MERGTATSFLPLRIVVLWSTCDYILGVKETSKRRPCKGWLSIYRPHLISPFSPPPTTIIIWEAFGLGDCLVVDEEAFLTTFGLLAQHFCGKVVGVSLALWASGFICPNNTLWHHRRPIDLVWNRTRIILVVPSSELLPFLDVTPPSAGVICKMLQGSITDQDNTVPGSNIPTQTSTGQLNAGNSRHHYTQPHLPSPSSISSMLEPSESPTLISPQNTQHPGLRFYRNLGEMVAAVQDAVLGAWVPHPLSPQEHYGFNQDTAQRLANIRALEELQRDVPLGANPAAERSLLLSRVDYRIRFWRTFRMNDLPTEIMTNIFRFVVWAAPDPRAGVRWRLWLTWTCKYWRTISLQDSTIWSAIWFRDLPPFVRSLAWVDRSGNAPLDIRINDSTERKFTDEEMGALMDKLCMKINSIRMLIIILEDWEPILTILDKLRSAATSAMASGNLLLIERFELHRSGSPYVQIGDGYQPSSLRHPLPLFGGVPTPKLTHFSINGVHVDWGRSHLHNLTTLDLRRMPLERSPELQQFRDILSNSPGLHKLCLDGAGPQWHPEDVCDYPPVQLSRLRILILADVSLHYALYILRHIAAPNVRDLTVMNLVGEDYAPLFGTMTARFPAVRLLTLFSVETLHTPGAGRALVKWLDSMPLLSYLRVANIKRIFLDAFLYNPETFQRVSGSSSTVRLVCPNVSILDFQSMQPQLIADWGVARREIGVPLKKFYITKENANKLSDGDKARLRAAAELNLKDYGAITVEEEQLSRA